MNKTIADKLLSASCRATGIGSMPHKDPQQATALILDKCPDIPYCPQLPKIDPRESMLLQVAENLPCLKADLDKKGVYYDESKDKEQELLKFYEALARDDHSFFKISHEYARGFYALVESCGDSACEFIKTQLVGPVTFLTSVHGEGDKALIHDDMFQDAIPRALAQKGISQAHEIKERGKSAIIFFDEPGLSALGSAFMPVEREKCASLINSVVNFVKEHEADTLIGTHCCGNSDWEMLLSTKIDILSFDSFGFCKNFLLYPDAINKFLARGSIIAWGAVPTTEYKDGMTADELCKKLNSAFNTLIKKGVDEKLLKQRALITSSCGMGLLDEAQAERILELTAQVANETL